MTVKLVCKVLIIKADDMARGLPPDRLEEESREILAWKSGTAEGPLSSDRGEASASCLLQRSLASSASETRVLCEGR